MPARYHFITRIWLGAPPPRIWETLARSEEWAEWWRWLRGAEVVAEGGPDGVGRQVRHVVTAPLGYRLAYTGEIIRAVEPVMSRFETVGDLEGRGQFRLDVRDDGVTLITFDWLVETSRAWMNRLAPLARPVFAWSHHRIMSDFARDLASAVAAEMLGVAHESRRPGEEGFFEMPLFEP